MNADLVTAGPIVAAGPIISDRRYNWTASYNIHTTYA
jgi:hypothetical protein